MNMAHSTTYLTILLLGMSISFVYGSLLESSARVRRLAPEQKDSDLIELWADTVVAVSSQYDTTRHSAQRAIGPPDVYPRYGDIPGSWTPSVRDSSQYIEVRFSRAVFVQKLDIYETFHAGGVRRLRARKTGSQWHILYQTDTVTKINSSRIFSPRITIPLNESVNEFRIDVDCTAGGTFNVVQIDAMKIHGYREMVQLWANKVIDYSSQYHKPSRFGAQRVLLQPDVYPRYGDITGAWSQADTSLNDAQYIQVGFAEALFLREVDIYETYNAGGVRKLSARMSNDTWQTLYHNDTVRKIARSRIFSPRITTPACPVNALRVEVDCTADVKNDYVEIDAIAIYGLKECSQGKWGQCCGRNCGKCWENSQCNKSTGNCPKIGASYRCAAGYHGTKCDRECGRGQFGGDCKHLCGHCANGNCSTDSGDCPTKVSFPRCLPGFHGALCKDVCNPGEYGQDCISVCGQCSGGPGSCSTISGVCSAGCLAGYTGDVCQTDNFTQLCEENNELPWVGWVVGFVIGMATHAAVVFIIWKCRQKVSREGKPGINSSSPNQGNESQSSTVADRSMSPDTIQFSAMPLHEIERVVEGAQHSPGVAREIDYLNVDNGDYSQLDVNKPSESNVYASIS